MSHYEQSEALLKVCSTSTKRRPTSDELMSEALIHAVLAVAEELQKINARARNENRPIEQTEVPRRSNHMEGRVDEPAGDPPHDS